MGSVTIISSGGGGGGDADDLATYRSNHRVAYYDCADDGTAGLQDSEGSNHLTENASSVATFGNTGVNGDCIGLTGNNDYFYLQSSNLCPDATEDFFLSLWFKDSSSPSTANIALLASNLSGGNPNLFMQLNSDRPRIGYNNATVATEATGHGEDAYDGNWNHLGYGTKIINGARCFFCYVNGILVGGPIFQASPSDLSAGFFIIGRVYSSGSVVGLIDEIEVFKGVGAFPTTDIVEELAAEY